MAAIDFDSMMRPGTTAIMFSLEPTASGALDTSRIPTEYLRKATAARDEHGGNVFVCLGGAGRSQAFAGIAANPKLRQRFVGELISYLTKHNLDGVDYDWEAPANAEQTKHYGQLLSNTKKMFRSHNLMVTAAIHVWQDLGTLAFTSVDRLHLMAYDAQEKDGRHSTLQTAMDYAGHVLKYGVNSGKDADAKFNAELIPKLMLGVPAYGRNKNNMGDVATYADIMRDHAPGPEIDELPSGMYFNGVNTIKQKASWVKRMGLGGVMMWELGQDSTDPKTSLLHALRQVQEDPAVKHHSEL